ncbi:zinc-binding alcohol dehydrogenase family protein [Marininema halotolerans]|uniref:Zinc-type alcohol dehydrogenase-like protein n=1 Tax=Marininema halotolerans TaxID=1155944 RepID=A0A1I6TNN2_9BACL|nr:zinc-binding alcohol dehydrogenase family protein [Marininema halotolerans]SFS90761.1 zinc-binding alcohol dehydrogenase family protein [Marininema halotolerans]
MEMMKAVGFYRYLPIEDPESLLDLKIEKPRPKGRDVLVRVNAIAVNPVDYKVRSPKEKVEKSPKILGWDVAGVIEEVGPDTTLFKPGDAVYYAGDITRPGGNSQFHLVDERIVGKKPSSLNDAEAAALPLTTITAYEALFDRMNIPSEPTKNKNKSLLIIGAAGGVGSIAIQLAKWAGLKVIGTASRAESIAWVKEQGADHTINHYEEFFPQLQEVGHETVDYILCLNATDKHWVNMAKVIAPQGKICSIVETDTPLDLTLLKSKSATFAWELMFTRPMYQTEDMIEQHHLLNKVADLVDNKVVKTTLTNRLSPINAENLRKAHQLLEQENAIGKTVVENFS